MHVDALHPPESQKQVGAARDRKLAGADMTVHEGSSWQRTVSGSRSRSPAA